MEKVEYRSVIKFFDARRCRSNRYSCPSGWCLQGLCLPLPVPRSKLGQLNFGVAGNPFRDDPRSGQPSDGITPETVKSVEDLVMKDRNLSVRLIADTLGISKGSANSILNEHLGMSKVCTKWIPKTLSPHQRQDRVDISTEHLEYFSRERDYDLQRVVTGDESWLRHYDPPTKLESRQWKRASSPTPTQERPRHSPGKILMSVFWDCEGMLLVDFLEDKQTITGDYYSHLMYRLRQAIREKRRGLLTKGVLLLHDNAAPHKARVSQAAIRECNFEQIPHPPYSPHMAPSDFYLFPNLKKHLRGKRFSNDFELKSETLKWFDAQTYDFYKTGIYKLIDRWTRVIASEGQYVD